VLTLRAYGICSLTTAPSSRNVAGGRQIEARDRAQRGGLAQQRGLTLFWAHDLQALMSQTEQTR